MITVHGLESLRGTHELRRMELKSPGMVRCNGRFVVKVAREAKGARTMDTGGDQEMVGRERR